MPAPKVSVIIPTYNRANSLAAALQSVLDQPYESWEVVVIDDGSTDETPAIMQKYAADARIRYLQQANQGVSCARNAGIAQARGAYIAFLDSDDLCCPNRLAEQAALLDADPQLGLVASGHIEVDEALQPIREVQPWLDQPRLRLEDMILGCPFTIAVMVRREWLRRVGGFDVQLRQQEDWDLWLRLAAHGCPMTWHQGPACRYRIHRGTLARDAALMRESACVVLDRVFARPALPASVLALKGRAYATVELDSAARACAWGDAETARTWLTTAVQLYPDLAAGDPPVFLSSLATFGLSLTPERRAAYAHAVMTAWPATLPRRWTTGKLLALMNVADAFEHYRHGAYRAVIVGCGRAALADVSWLRRRWWWSMSVHALWRSARPSAAQA